MKRTDVKNEANISCLDKLEEICLKLDCCKVGSWYEYCPKCGKKLISKNAKNGKLSHIPACMNCLII